MLKRITRPDGALARVDDGCRRGWHPRRGSPSHLQETPYVGLHVIVAVALLAVVLLSLLIERLPLPGWLLAARVYRAILPGFLLRRTTRLPGYYESWTRAGGSG